MQAILGSLPATARRAAHPRGRSLALLAVIVACAAWPAAAGSATLPPGFQERIVFAGLTNPMAVAFAPDGRVFVGQKNGQIKVFDSLTDTTPTIFADLRTNTYDNWDRGLLGLALDPQFPARPFVYVLYTYDARPGGTAPTWNDACPTPPGPTDDGCVVTGRLSRLTASGNTTTGAEQVLIQDWCQQFPSHSVGSLEFAADGSLYVSAGDGASWTFADHGQNGNPCGDPPGGTAIAPPSAEGGALRSQDIRTAADPLGLDGTILRIDPNTGAGVAGNPFATNANANWRRVVATGLRNPFRTTVRPGTNELWIADVGWNTWEEINRYVPSATLRNFGWPCYEGAGRTAAYDAANLKLCEDLYAAGTAAVTAPYHRYSHSSPVVAGDGCTPGGSSISGIAFASSQSTYPDAYDGALFFSDYTRNCIWTMRAGTNGLPSPALISPLMSGGGGPVDLVVGPGGDLFYVAIITGDVRRIVHPIANGAPNAVASATPTSGAAPLTVTFESGTSSDPDAGDTITRAWDLDGDGAFDDSTAVRPTWTYTVAGNVVARLRVTDSHGATDIASVTIAVGNTPPAVTLVAPTATTTWAVGDTIAFRATATDAQDGTLAASRLTWKLTLQHCATPVLCHAHPVQEWPGVASGSFVAPDHEYPAYLDLEVTATDSGGLTDRKTVRLDPRTVTMTLQTSPSGLDLVLNGEQATAPFTRTLIAGSHNTMTALVPQPLPEHRSDTFGSWSDGGAQTHAVTAAQSGTFTATFLPPTNPPSTPACDAALAPAACWSFGESGGTTAADSSGNGNAGTYGGGPVLGVPGAVAGDTAVSLHGVDDHVVVPDSPTLDVGDSLSLEAWIKRDTADLTHQVFNKGSGGFHLVVMDRFNGNQVWLRKAGVTTVARSDGGVPADGRFHHVVATKNGATARIYIDGVAQAVTGSTGTVLADTADRLFMSALATGQKIAGDLDEFAVYDRALTAAEVTRRFQRATAPAGLTAPALAGPLAAPATLTAQRQAGRPAARAVTAAATPAKCKDIGTATSGVVNLKVDGISCDVAIWLVERGPLEVERGGFTCHIRKEDFVSPVKIDRDCRSEEGWSLSYRTVS